MSNFDELKIGDKVAYEYRSSPPCPTISDLEVVTVSRLTDKQITVSTLDGMRSLKFWKKDGSEIKGRSKIYLIDDNVLKILDKVKNNRRIAFLQRRITQELKTCSLEQLEQIAQIMGVKL